MCSASRTPSPGTRALRWATKENIKLVFSEDYWWPKAVSGLYRPLTTLSYLANYAVLGNRDHAAGYLAVNLSLHWVAAVLVYFLAAYHGRAVGKVDKQPANSS